MSKCISARGEYSSHTPGRDAICTHCGVFDLDAWLVAHDAEVAAKALEDAADDLRRESVPDKWGTGPTYGNYARWLRARASGIIRGTN